MPETTIIIIAVCIIAGIGLVVHKQYDKTGAALILQRQQYVDRAIKGINVENYDSFANSLNNKGYLTSSLYTTTQSLIDSYAAGSFSSNPAYNKIICVDDVPSSYEYGAVKINSSGTSATVKVNVFVPDSLSSTPYEAYWVNTNGSWQLNNVSC